MTLLKIENLSKSFRGLKAVSEASFEAPEGGIVALIGPNGAGKTTCFNMIAGVFYAFYYNNLFPEQIFQIGRSIEIILGPVIGGVGTLFGPVLGAAMLTVLSDSITELLARFGWEFPGLKQVFYGLVLLLVVMFLPNGVWPAIAKRLRL